MNELEAENDRLRQALAATRDLISDAWYRVGPDWRIVDANPRFEAAKRDEVFLRSVLDANTDCLKVVELWLPAADGAAVARAPAPVVDDGEIETRAAPLRGQVLLVDDESLLRKPVDAAQLIERVALLLEDATAQS